VRLTPILLVLLLAACAAPSGGSPSGDAPTDSPRPDPTPTPSLKPASVQPSPEPASPPAGGTELVGTLGSDAVEGGCAYLEASDGTRYEVIYPDGWTLQKSPLQLRAPDGTVVARAGDEVTVRGSETTDMASICMIGPIFRATSVDR
jgi:hypothetical protein